jgi:hypothetical protein
VKLPLWRLIGGVAVLGAFAVVLVLLAPVYIDNYRLNRYVNSLPTAGATDESLRAEIIEHAHQLDLPVQSGDIQISHMEGKTHVQMAYKVAMTFYPVDLHMSAAGR